MELMQATSDKGQERNCVVKLSDFDYVLPKDRIAQQPLPQRDASRLLVLNRGTGTIEHRRFRDLLDCLRLGDTLVLNDTKVVPARIYGRRTTGGKVEMVLLCQRDAQTYEALLSPSSNLAVGSRILFGEGMEAEVVGGSGTVKEVRFAKNGLGRWLQQKGLIPLPPYIRRPPTREDVRRYQTVDARREGAVAVPTAGLHFTKGLLQEIRRRGIRVCPVTLHVGYGTFEPVREEGVAKHKMHEEYFEISGETCRVLDETRRRGGRIVAVGTTSCRVLETNAPPRGPATAFPPNAASAFGLSLASLGMVRGMVSAVEPLATFGRPPSRVTPRHVATVFPTTPPGIAGATVKNAPHKRDIGRGAFLLPASEDAQSERAASGGNPGGVVGFRPMKGWTDLFIYPPYEFQGTDALLTNFHLPKSTLLMLVSAFAGMGVIRKAYQEAIEGDYRFYSYGDAMLIL